MIFSHSKKISRSHAALAHFGISLAIFSIFLWVLLQVWYPTPYFTASGGWQGLRIVAFVDLVLGPLLTLVVFNPNKKHRELSIDLSLIVLLQLGALIWGINTVYDQRPVAAVYWENHFYSVPAVALSKQGLSPQDFKKYGDGKPPLILAEKPNTVEGIMEMSVKVQAQQVPPYQLEYLYRPFKGNHKQIFKRPANINEIITHNQQMKVELDRFLQKQNKGKGDFVYLSLRSKYHNVILIFSPKADLIGSIDAPYAE